MALGRVRHNHKKVRRSALRSARSYAAYMARGADVVPLPTHDRKVRVEVAITRNITMATGRGIFEAHACVAGHGRDGGGRRKCGRLARGTTPTKAMKAALRNLVANLQ